MADQKPTAYLHGVDRTRSSHPLHAASPVKTGAHKSCPSAQFERWIPVFTGNRGRRLAPEPAKAGATKTERGPPHWRHPQRHSVWGSSLMTRHHCANRKNRWMDPLMAYAIEDDDWSGSKTHRVPTWRGSHTLNPPYPRRAPSDNWGP